MPMDSQCVKIHLYLKNHVGITSFEAFSIFGITRLAARIADLREIGIPIDTVMKTKKTEDGTTIRFAEYRLRKDVRNEKN